MNAKDIRAIAAEKGNKVSMYTELRRRGVNFRKEVLEFGLDGVASRKEKEDYLAANPTSFHLYDVAVKSRKTGWSYNRIRAVRICTGVATCLALLLDSEEVNRRSLAYKSALEALQAGKARTGKNTGSGSYASSTSWTADTAAILDSVGAIYVIGNDAARGGRHGEYIEIV